MSTTNPDFQPTTSKLLKLPIPIRLASLPLSLSSGTQLGHFDIPTERGDKMIASVCKTICDNCMADRCEDNSFCSKAVREHSLPQVGEHEGAPSLYNKSEHKPKI